MEPFPQAVAVPEYNKGQRVTHKNRQDIFLINNAALRGDYRAGKKDDRQVVRRRAGQLPDSMEHILVDEDAVSWLQNRMSLSHLIVQDTALRCGNLKVGMPVYRSRAVWQSGEFIAIKSNGEGLDIKRDLLPQLMIK